MLKVAVASQDSTVYGMVPALFEDSTHLLIMDADTDQILQVLDGQAFEPFRRSIHFAQKVVELDCEALLCGNIEAQPFSILAEENSVTRYDASELNVLDAINWMNNNTLDLITDYIGGTGCPDPDPSNCEHNSHGDDD